MQPHPSIYPYPRFLWGQRQNHRIHSTLRGHQEGKNTACFAITGTPLDQGYQWFQLIGAFYFEFKCTFFFNKKALWLLVLCFITLYIKKTIVLKYSDWFTLQCTLPVHDVCKLDPMIKCSCNSFCIVIVLLYSCLHEDHKIIKYSYYLRIYCRLFFISRPFLCLLMHKTSPKSEV